MAELPAAIRQLIRAGRIERVAVNTDHALAVVSTAERHLETARILAGTDDLAMAFTAAYDGTRKALGGVLAVNGLRVRPVGGAHHNTGVAAAALLDDDALGEFEWMRQVRNATEYPQEDRPTATQQDVAEAIAAGEAIVATCAAYVRSAGVDADGP